MLLFGGLPLLGCCICFLGGGYPPFEVILGHCGGFPAKTVCNPGLPGNPSQIVDFMVFFGVLGPQLGPGKNLQNRVKRRF